MTDANGWPPEAREALEWHLASHFSGNRMPHMSGDPRARLNPVTKRRMDDAIDTALAALAPWVARIEAAAFKRGAEAGIKVSADYCHGRTTSRSFGSWADAFEAAERGIRALPIPEDKQP